MNLWTVAAFSAAFSYVSVFVTLMLIRRLKLGRPNFKGKMIPVAFGFMLVPAAVPVYAIMLQQHFASGKVMVFLVAVVGFAGLGLLDDLYGTRDVGGFRGHLGQLKHGRVSTGLMKAVGGGLLGFMIGFFIGGMNPAAGIINGFLIALASNTVNLLDLRPGRAVSCLWVGILSLAIAKLFRLSIWPELVPVLIPALKLTMLDRSAKAMLGDTGSNALGGILGVAIAYEAGIPVKIAVLLFMAAIHIYSEKHSISKLIESHPVLRNADRLLGER